MKDGAFKDRSLWGPFAVNDWPCLLGQSEPVWLVLFPGAGDSAQTRAVCMPVLCSRATSLGPDILITTHLIETVFVQDSHVSSLQRRQCCVLDWMGECLASKQGREDVWDLLDGMLSEYQVCWPSGESEHKHGSPQLHLTGSSTSPASSEAKPAYVSCYLLHTTF